ncbi:hypothetical protein CASFOL_032052 [Castilleja foliolosa]|uniref:Uncharacterized protein n=1 Tax=Castilleja foliolosa TaxID=1961234 RepID=A0ABD3C1I8_9LAMI
METKSVENHSIATVLSLYDTISSGAREFSGLISNELEWWFHGPQNSHHMMKMLTGKSSPSDFRFTPRSIDTIDGGSGVLGPRVDPR